MTFLFHPDAELEFNQSIDYYENIRAGLGHDFAVEAYLTIQRIIEYPEAWPVFDGDVRRSLLRRFPYGVLYTLENGSVFIVAVMNLHRAPDYWQDRN